VLADQTVTTITPQHGVLKQAQPVTPRSASRSDGDNHSTSARSAKASSVGAHENTADSMTENHERPVGRVVGRKHNEDGSTVGSYHPTEDSIQDSMRQNSTTVHDMHTSDGNYESTAAQSARRSPVGDHESTAA
jgi:hypothetical protein